MSWISPEPYYHSTNDFRAFENMVGEHSIVGVPASLYNLTKSVPDPFIFSYTNPEFQALT